MTTATWTPPWTNRRGVARRLLDAALALPVTVDSVATSRLSAGEPGGWQRVTTVVEAHGGGLVGRGEDIAYNAAVHDVIGAIFAALEIGGTRSVGELSALLDEQRISPPAGAGMDDKPQYHRWAVESAVLDLALQQHGTDLAGLVDVPWATLTFSSSMGLGSPPSTDKVRAWKTALPSTTFKIDSGNEWTQEHVDALAALDAVTTVDFKGLYHGDWIDNDPLPANYSMIARGLPHALLEDARLNAEILDALDEHGLSRLSWDYPITRPEDVPGLPGSTATFSDLRPAAINIKPSRFGTLERLLGTIDLCDREQIPCYAGGQYELGIGRTQVQSIAALCFPDAPNDCAPVEWHGAKPGDPGVPASPLLVPAHAGFGWV